MSRHTDGRNGSGKTVERRPARRTACSAVCLLAFWAGTLQAQSPVVEKSSGAPDPGGKVHGNVRPIDATSANNRIHLLTGHGVMIDVDRPIKRADVGTDKLVDVTIISPQQVMVSARAVGTTHIILWDGDGTQAIYAITVQPDLAPLREAISNAAPGSKVTVQSLGNTIVLSGSVADVDTANRVVQLAELFVSSLQAADTSGQDKGQGVSQRQMVSAAAPASSSKSGGSPTIVNHLSIAGEHQVVLRCTVAEVTKSAIRALGINGWMAGSNFADVFVVNQIAGINPANIGAAGGINVEGFHIPFLTGQGGIPLTTTPELSLGFPDAQLQIFIKALRDNRLLRVMAEPNLVAISGQEATFLAGGEFPSVASSGVSGTQITWKEFGVRLRFVPTVMGRQMIRLRVAPEVSELDPSTGISTPEIHVPFGLTQRRAETTIELASGSTIAIAGLLSERVRGISQKVPALGDVPVLGALFASKNFQKDVTELVILVTPEIVASLQPDQVDPVPGQFMKDPDDCEFYGLGMLEGKSCPEATDPAAALQTRTPPRYPKLAGPPSQMTLHGPWGPADATEGMQ